MQIDQSIRHLGNSHILLDILGLDILELDIC